VTVAGETTIGTAAAALGMVDNPDIPASSPVRPVSAPRRVPLLERIFGTYVSNLAIPRSLNLR
ncbi:MAG: hypothetical protein OK454_10690, partial [Thaumarchaeota archaeon]|nr:hypothetical protein [Nitrososphaerota archaeon]